MKLIECVEFCFGRPLQLILPTILDEKWEKIMEYIFNFTITRSYINGENFRVFIT